jgi:Prealbumin-like fold domain
VAQTLGAGVAEAAVNTGTTVQDGIAPPPPAPPVPLGDSEFGEAGIDLTDAGVFPAGQCVNFGQGFAVSRSSGNSAQAQMKDLVGPGEVNIQNCGNVIIHKVTVPSPDPTDTTFDYTTTGGLNPATFQLKDGETRNYGGLVIAGDYSVTETDPGPNFATTLDCSASETDGGSTFDVVGRTVTFSLEPLDTIECTYTNTLQRGALRILKQSTKTGTLVANAGAVFSYDGSTVTDNGTGDEDATIGEVCVSGLLPGSYTVNETSPPDGYGGATQTNVTATVVVGTNCTDNQPSDANSATFTNAPLADIQVNFRDGGSGETSATSITCANAVTTPDTTPASGWDDSVTHLDIPIDPSPRTVTCTIVIDP